MMSTAAGKIVFMCFMYPTYSIYIAFIGVKDEFPLRVNSMDNKVFCILSFLTNMNSTDQF